MRDHKELNRLVVQTLSKRRVNLTAIEVYHEIRIQNPRMVSKGFKSFVKIINAFPDIEPQTIVKGKPMVYKAIV